MSPWLEKYLALIGIAARQTRRARAEMFGRAVFFVVVLGVFSSLWRAVAEAGMPLAAEPKALVWYLAITEWIILSTPQVHFDVQEAIRRGDIVCQLGRPVSWVGAAFCEGLGALMVRMPVLLVIAASCASIFAGWTPPLRVLLVVVPLGLFAGCLMTGLNLGIGLLAFWLDDVSPVSWVWQKLLFVFGGLLMPMELYPDIVRRLAPWTPFPSVLSGPASIVLHQSAAGGLLVARDLVAWGAVTAVAVSLLFRRAIAVLTVNGG